MKIGDIRSTQDPEDPFPHIKGEHHTAEVLEIKDGWVRFKRGFKNFKGEDDIGQMREEAFKQVYPKEVAS